MYLLTKWFGTFLYGEKGIKNKILFPKDEKKIAKLLLQINNNEILSEEKKIVKGINVIVNEKRLQKLGKYDLSNPVFKKIKIKAKDFDLPEELLHK